MYSEIRVGNVGKENKLSSNVVIHACYPAFSLRVENFCYCGFQQQQHPLLLLQLSHFHCGQTAFCSRAKDPSQFNQAQAVDTSHCLTRL